MARKKRVTRKQLLKEPDKVITTTGKVIQTIQVYKTQLSYVAGALIVMLLVIVGLRYYSDVRENRAFAMLDQALSKYEARKSDVGAKQAYQDTMEDFERIVNAYSAKNGGKMARLLFADICYDAGEFERAVLLYNRSLEDFDGNAFFKKLIISSLGHAHQGKNDLKTAQNFYQTNADDAEPFLRDEALFHLGKIYDAMGKNLKSQEAFQEIITEFPASIYVNMVSEKVPG